MIEIQNTILSLDIFNEKFVCDLSKCKGQCCVEGDAGAPLEKEEVQKLEEIYPYIKKFLRKEGIEAIEIQGTSVEDIDGEDVTPLINDQECAYVIFDEKGITKCGIELAYENNATDYMKPISCHLYPIRITKYQNYDALNYDRWPICKDACTLGEQLKVSVLDFLEKPLIRKYGEAWFKEAQKIQQELKKSR